MAHSTIGRYLVQRLQETGLGHVFGIPGDYVLSFYDLLVASRMKVIGTCSEIGAGYAADAYARVHGLGCVCITYCVGGLNAVNAVAGAYAEKSPLIVISGSPGLGERKRSSLLHHQVRDYRTQLQIYEKVTVAAAALEDAAEAPRVIDETIAACLRHKRPVFLELPRDMVHAPCAAPKRLPPEKPRSDRKSLAECVAEAAGMIRRAKRPAILAGVEVHRFRIQDKLVKLVERTGFPVAATLLGKSVISETHPQYIGVYEGAMGRDSVRKTIESADCLLILGAFMTDINLGIYTAHLDESRTINATSERITIAHHHYDDIVLAEFIDKLGASRLGKRGRTRYTPLPRPRPFRPRPGRAITVRRFFERIDASLELGNVVICDIGDSLFGAADLTIQGPTEFLSPAYYTSMGFAIPAAVGAQIGKSGRRPVVFVGDGAFQMTGNEIATIAKYGLNPVIFVLNNKGYTTERFIREGPYNDIHDLAYHLWPQLVRDGWGCEVRTEGELEQAIARAGSIKTCFSIINVHLGKMDCSNALARLGKRLGARAGARTRKPSVGGRV